MRCYFEVVWLGNDSDREVRRFFQKHGIVAKHSYVGGTDEARKLKAAVVKHVGHRCWGTIVVFRSAIGKILWVGFGPKTVQLEHALLLMKIEQSKEATQREGLLDRMGFAG
jgi:hypothetical protein